MTVLWAMTLGAIIVAIVAMLYSTRLRKEVNRLKHQQFELSNLLKRMEEDFSVALQPIRLQLAKVASGKAVSTELILSGRLFREVSSEQALEMLRQGQEQGHEPLIVIDVRTRREFAEKRLSGAILVPFEDLDQQYQKAIPEEAEQVLLYCTEGERSKMACEYLSQQGYTNLFHLRHGLQDWEGPTEGEGAITFIQIEKKAVSTTR